MESNNTKHKWLKKQDFLDNMKTLSRVCCWLGIIRYKCQLFGSGRYTGKFKFVLINPLTWILLALIFVLLFFASLYSALRYSTLNIKHFVADGVVIEVGRDYKSKNRLN